MTFCGDDITGIPRHRVSQKGVARTFQLVKPFLEAHRSGECDGGQGLRTCPGEEPGGGREDPLRIFDRLGLVDKAKVLAKSLTIMQRKRLELARALAAKPRLLLLDELMAGLNPHEADDACDLVGQIRKAGITLVVVEHIVKAICGLSDRVVVLNMGEKIAEGPPDEIVHNPNVIDVYLGKAHA